MNPSGQIEDPRIDRVTALFAADPEVVFAFLFGSRVTGRITPMSDTDLGVYLKSEPGRLQERRLALLDEVVDALETDKVDLVLLNEASPELAHHILKEGRLLFCRDELSLIRYRVRMVNRYLDQQPMRDLFYRYLSQRVKEGGYGR